MYQLLSYYWDIFILFTVLQLLNIKAIINMRLFKINKLLISS